MEGESLSVLYQEVTLCVYQYQKGNSMFYSFPFCSSDSSRGSTSSFRGRQRKTALTECCEPKEEMRCWAVPRVVSLARVERTSDPSLEVLNERRRFTLWITLNPGLFFFF